MVTSARRPRLPYRRVWDRDGWRCVECGTHQNLTVDHILPRSRGGSDDISNLQTMCRPCNSRKGAGKAADKTFPYQQLAGRIRDAIAAGQYGPREAIPSLKQLVGETGLAMGTVQRAIQLLEDEGVVYTVSGRGTFVTPPGAHGGST